MIKDLKTAIKTNENFKNCDSFESNRNVIDIKSQKDYSKESIL